MQLRFYLTDRNAFGDGGVSVEIQEQSIKELSPVQERLPDTYLSGSISYPIYVVWNW